MGHPHNPFPLLAGICCVPKTMYRVTDQGYYPAWSQETTFSQEGVSGNERAYLSASCNGDKIMNTFEVEEWDPSSQTWENMSALGGSDGLDYGAAGVFRNSDQTFKGVRVWVEKGINIVNHTRKFRLRLRCSRGEATQELRNYCGV